MKFDDTYKNITKVRELIQQSPTLPDFTKFSTEARELLFDAHDYLDIIIGYASWYVQRKSPSLFQAAFMDQNFFTKINLFRNTVINSNDFKCIKEIEKVVAYINTLQTLMFKPLKNGKNV